MSRRYGSVFDLRMLTQPSAYSMRMPSSSLRETSCGSFAFAAASTRAIAASLSSTLKFISPELAYTPLIGRIISEKVFPSAFAFTTSPRILSAARTPESHP